MGYSLIDQSRTVKNQAKRGLQDAAKMEQKRNLTNDGLERQESQAKAANATAGATTGAMIGASIGAAGTATAATTGVAATGLAGMGAMGAGLATGGIGLAAGLLLTELL